MKRYGTDSLNSWVIALACCFCNAMTFGLGRLSGMLLIASMSRFNVSREKASFPYTLATFVRYTSGPIVGCLGHRFGVRSVTTFGCLIGAVGVGTCFFVENIDSITILWGVVFGVGYGLGNILLPLFINKHFEKHKATASGISYSGACLGSFILPPIVDLLIDNYGLSGTYLLISAFLLNCVPAALLLKEPKLLNISEKHSYISGNNNKCYTVEDDYKMYVRKYSDDEQNKNNPIRDVFSQQPYAENLNGLSVKTFLSENSFRMKVLEPINVGEIIDNINGKVDCKATHAKLQSLTPQDMKQDCRDNAFNVHHISVKHDKSNSPNLLTNVYENYAYLNDPEDLISEDETIRVNPHFIVEEKNQNIKSKYYPKSIEAQKIYKEGNGNYKNNIIEPEAVINKNKRKTSNQSSAVTSIVEPKATCFAFDNIQQKKNNSREIFKLFVDPIFILIAFTYGMYTFIFVCLITIIVDFGRDINIESSSEKYILMALSIGDIIGCLGLGWVTDRGYMTTTAFTAFLFACQGIMMTAIVFSRGLMTLLLFANLYGVAEAGLIVLFPVIISQYIEHDKQSIAIPSSNFLAGPICLAVAPLIGVFRDRLGTYSYLYYGMIMMSFLCCLLWILAPNITKYRKKN